MSFSIPSRVVVYHMKNLHLRKLEKYEFFFQRSKLDFKSMIKNMITYFFEKNHQIQKNIFWAILNPIPSTIYNIVEWVWKIYCTIVDLFISVEELLKNGAI